MKQLIYPIIWVVAVLGIIFSGCEISEGAEITSATDQTYVENVQKEVRLTLPPNCSAFQGELALNNCNLISITEDYATKDIYTNGNKFVIYGLNQDEMVGDNLVITVNVTNNQEAVIGIADPLGATPDAQPVSIDVFSFAMTSSLDLNGDGVLDNSDIVLMVGKVFDNDATVVNLQAIINAYLNEL